jgi:hypothetical protein
MAAVGIVLALALNDPARGAKVTVFNAEAACRGSPSDDCRLGLVGDPYAEYGPANVVGHVRHGDRLVAGCYVTGATLVTAEDGRRSDRWYRVGDAWLPAVRLAPAARPSVPRCGTLPQVTSCSPTNPPGRAPGGTAKTALPVWRAKRPSPSCRASRRWTGTNWRAGSRMNARKSRPPPML